jgi:hypothetical protein
MAMPISPGPPLVVGKPSLLFRGEFALLQGKDYDVTRDGQRFLMVQTVEREQPRTVSVVLNWLAEFAVRRLAINYCQRASTFANACCWLFAQTSRIFARAFARRSLSLVYRSASLRALRQ